MAQLHVPSGDWPHLRRPLEPGEQALAEYFERTLDDTWTIYVQVWLNGAEVDVAAWSPQHGLLLYEVKDWHPGRDLVVRDQTLWDVKRSGGQRDPVSQVEAHRRVAVSPLCPLGRVDDGDRLVVSGVYMHNWRTADARSLLTRLRPSVSRHRGSMTHPIVGGDARVASRIDEFLGGIAARRQSSSLLGADGDMRRLLADAETDAEQRQPLPLSRSMLRLATSRTSFGYRRISGPAGSGKTSVVAARAVELSAQGRRPLVVSFNHTLWHYIKDMAVRHRPAEGRARIGRIAFMTFHEWCRQACDNAGVGKQFDRVVKAGDEYPSNDILDLVESALGHAPAEYLDGEASSFGYTDLLVDEAQDLDARSWDLLRRSVLDGEQAAERVVAFDSDQNLYSRDLEWVRGEHAAATAGFHGPPVRLAYSYRLPPRLLVAVNDYRTQLLGLPPDEALESAVNEAHAQLQFGCEMRWLQVSPDRFATALGGAAVGAPQEMGLNPADVVVLVSTHRDGLRVVQRLQEAGYSLKHVFGIDHNERRHHKVAFYKGQKMLASTIHSFKGYEQRGVVLGIPSPADSEDGSNLVALYIALTRVKAMPDGASALTVVCADEALAEFGSRWFDPPPTGG